MDALRNLARDAAELDLVASPVKLFPLGRLQVETTDVLDRPARPVRTRYPFGKPEPKLTGLARHLNAGVHKPPRQIAGVDLDIERWASAGNRSSRRDIRPRRARDQNQENEPGERPAGPSKLME